MTKHEGQPESLTIRLQDYPTIQPSHYLTIALLNYGDFSCN